MLQNKVQIFAPCRNEKWAGLLHQNMLKGGNALATARRTCHRCTCASTSIIIVDVIMQCPTRLWRCKLWFSSACTRHKYVACHCIQGICDRQKTSSHVMKNIQKWKSWSDWWTTSTETKNNHINICHVESLIHEDRSIKKLNCTT
jgi:hypothetical protein